MLKTATVLSLLVAAPAFAAADGARLQATAAPAGLTARPSGGSAAVAEAAAWRTLTGGLLRSSAQLLAAPEQTLAALATPELGGEIGRALHRR